MGGRGKRWSAHWRWSPIWPRAMRTWRWIQKNFDWDWSGAQSSFARALELAPQNAIALRRAGTLAWTLGRMEEGFELTRRALEQDPLSAHAYSNLGELPGCATAWRNRRPRFARRWNSHRRKLRCMPGSR